MGLAELDRPALSSSDERSREEKGRPSATVVGHVSSSSHRPSTSVFPFTSKGSPPPSSVLLPPFIARRQPHTASQLLNPARSSALGPPFASPPIPLVHLFPSSTTTFSFSSVVAAAAAAAVAVSPPSHTPRARPSVRHPPTLR